MFLMIRLWRVLIASLTIPQALRKHRRSDCKAHAPRPVERRFLLVPEKLVSARPICGLRHIVESAVYPLG